MPFKFLAGLHYPYPLINVSLFSDSDMGILLLHTVNRLLHTEKKFFSWHSNLHTKNRILNKKNFFNDFDVIFLFHIYFCILHTVNRINKLRILHTVKRIN